MITDFRGLLEVLCREGVRFVLIGGVAARIHGSARLTDDLDLVYARDDENLLRLSAALRDLEPYPRGAPPGLPFKLDGITLRLGRNFALHTNLGDLDLFGEITAGGLYEDLLAYTQVVKLYEFACRCIDLPALLRTKRAVGRPRDYEVIAELEAIQEERGRGYGSRLVEHR